MNHLRIYEEIIKKSQSQYRRKYKGIYYEKHHIIPRCLGGDNDKSNLVLLTAKEHYVCHKLLTYIYKGNRGIVCAFHRMTYGNTGNHIKSSRDYSYARELISKTPLDTLTLEKMRIRTLGEGNPMYGKPGVLLGKKLSKEHRMRQSESKIGEKNPQYGNTGFATGYKFTDEQRKNLSKSQLKRFSKKENHPLYGKFHSEETKRKISESIKKKNEKNSYIIRK